MILPRNKIAKTLKSFWDIGYNTTTSAHAVQFIQERWDCHVLNGSWNYFQFKAFKNGFYSRRRDDCWGLNEEEF